MLIYRLDRLKRENQVLSGKGSEMFGGRWNYPGIPAVYCAENRALTVLEILAHLDKDHWPNDRIMVSFEIPDESMIHKMDVAELDSGWNSFPYTDSSQRIFGEFVQSNNHCILAVPSAIVPDEFNFVINPNHPKATQIRVIDKKAFVLDHRLLK